MRLTSPMRRDILEALEHQRHETLTKNTREREQELAMLLYRRTITPEIEKAADALNDTLPGMVRTNCNIRAACQEGNSGYLFMGHARPAPQGQLFVILMQDDPAYEDVNSFMQTRIEWRDKTLAARASAKAQLAKFKTVEELAAGWPEIMSIAKPIIDEVKAKEEAKKAQLPAMVPAELNDMFGLPVEEKELEAA